MKAIILARVSTTQQDYERQIEDLKKEAIKEGFTDIEVIADKESAIKLDEYERHGLNELKEVCSGGNVGLVLVWEISRLARRQAVLYSIRDYLVERNIQLIVFTPYIKLLDHENKITESANLMFALFGAMAESEMSVKKERLKAGKNFKKKQGIYVGGNLPFGYKVGPGRVIQIDEEKEPIVLEIFRRYADGETWSTITSSLWKQGKLSQYETFHSAVSALTRMTKMVQYKGEEPKMGYVCPRIVDDELWNRCQERTKSYCKKRSEYNIGKACMGRKLLYWGTHCFTICHTIKSYSVNDRYEKLHWNISISLVEDMIWTIVKDYYKPIDAEKTKKELARRHKELNCELRKLVKDNDGFDAKIERIENRIIDGKLNEVRGDKMIEDTKKEKVQNELQISKTKSRIEEVIKELAALKNGTINPAFVDDYEERCKLAKDTIERIDLTKGEKFTGTGVVTLKDGRTLNIKLRFTARTQEWSYI